MPKIINVEKSKFINDNIEIYTSNRLGQFSKFLDKAPFYVTYFPVNEAATTTDLGTGNIDQLFGPNSPIRYNRIGHLPVFNIPELKPDIEMDESEGVDMSLDISDITFLPNTIKPRPYDLMLIELPNAKQMLFRCNTFRVNSVQSNDFYMADFDLKKYDDDLEAKYLSTQIIDRYETVYENIGTQDKCFIREDDVEKINTLVRTIELMRDGYINNFYNKQTNSFLLQDNLSIFKVQCMVGELESGNKKTFVPITSVIDGDNYKWVDVEYRHDEYLYDPFIEKFITSSGMLNDPDRNETYVLTRNDIVQPDFEALYSRTLYWALEQHNAVFLAPFLYCYQMAVKEVGSVYKVFDIPVNSLRLMVSGYDRFMPAERKVQEALTAAVDGFEKAIQDTLKYSDHWTEEDLAKKIKILNKAKIHVYEKRTVEEIERFKMKIANKLTSFKTKRQILQDEIRKQLEDAVANLDPLTYDEESMAQIFEIHTKYIHILEAAPFHVYDQIYDEFMEEINEIPQLSEDEIWKNIRKRYISKLQDLYSYYVGEMELPAELVNEKFTECLMDLESCENDDTIMVSYVDKFDEFCTKLLEGEDDDDETTEPVEPPVDPENPGEKEPEEDKDDKNPELGEGEDEW